MAKTYRSFSEGIRTGGLVLPTKGYNRPDSFVGSLKFENLTKQEIAAISQQTEKKKELGKKLGELRGQILRVGQEVTSKNVGGLRKEHAVEWRKRCADLMDIITDLRYTYKFSENPLKPRGNYYNRDKGWY